MHPWFVAAKLAGDEVRVRLEQVVPGARAFGEFAIDRTASTVGAAA